MAFAAGGLQAFMYALGVREVGDGHSRSLLDLMIRLSWLANPSFWIGVVLFVMKRWSSASGFGLIALGFGGLVVFPGVFMPDWWLWMASFVLLFIAASVCAPQSRNDPSRKAAAVDPDF
jgi:hypothetical protein